MFRHSIANRYPSSRDHRFRLGRRSQRLGPNGLFAWCLIQDLVDCSNSASSVGWILPFRHRVRALEELSPRAALTFFVTDADDYKSQLIAIWLRGRCGGTKGTKQLFELYESANRRERKELVRCLKKLSAWDELRSISEVEPDPRICNMAKPRGPRDVDAKMARFCTSMKRHKISARPTPLEVADDTKIGPRTPGKSVRVIREILERIHRIVSADRKFSAKD